MKENVIIVNCKVPSEAYQILSVLRRDLSNDSFTITQAAVVKKEAGKLTMEDGFIAGNPLESHSWTGGLIGSLVGILGGPLGVLLGCGVGELIGDSMDVQDLEDNAALLTKAGDCLVDGETALLLTVQEEDEAALNAKLKDFQVSLTRLGAAEIASEIEEAEKQKLLKEEAAEEAPALPEGEASKEN